MKLLRTAELNAVSAGEFQPRSEEKPLTHSLQNGLVFAFVATVNGLLSINAGAACTLIPIGFAIGFLGDYFLSETVNPHFDD